MLAACRHLRADVNSSRFPQGATPHGARRRLNRLLKKFVGRTFQSVKRAFSRQDDRLESRSHMREEFSNGLLRIHVVAAFARIVQR
jgi:hypothetical protein